MPLSALAEVLVRAVIELVAPMVAETAVVVGKEVVGEVREARARERQLARAQVLAGADLLVLAAAHDHVVTEAERGELARVLVPVFERAEVEVTIEALIERWSERMRSIATVDALRRTIASTASVLTEAQRKRAFDAVLSLVKADANAVRSNEGPMRAAATTSKTSTVRLFGEALGIEPDLIARRLRS